MSENYKVGLFYLNNITLIISLPIEIIITSTGSGSGGGQCGDGQCRVTSRAWNEISAVLLVSHAAGSYTAPAGFRNGIGKVGSWVSGNP